MGYAFTLPIFKMLGKSRVGCYVHYPTITKEMLKRVSTRSHTYNNRNIIARSPFLTAAKLFYYKIFAFVCRKRPENREKPGEKLITCWIFSCIRGRVEPQKPLWLIQPGRRITSTICGILNSRRIGKYSTFTPLPQFFLLRPFTPFLLHFLLHFFQ